MKIEIFYDGAYPNLCSGDLKVEIDGKLWEFPEFCLSSGGGVHKNENWDMFTTNGSWTIKKWPLDFPDRFKSIVIYEVNEKIPQGCCGGCI